MSCTDNKNPKESIIHAPMNGNECTYTELAFCNGAFQLPGESSTTEFIASTIGVQSDDINILLRHAPAADRAEILRMGEALRRRRHHV